MLRPEVVLAIDDDPESLAASFELLQSAGYEVATASNGLDALQQLQAGLRPRALLIDLSMPHLDGWRLCEILDAEPELAAIPRIIVTAERRVSSLKLRARVVVPKPVNIKALLDALNRESFVLA